MVCTLMKATGELNVMYQKSPAPIPLFYCSFCVCNFYETGTAQLHLSTHLETGAMGLSIARMIRNAGKPFRRIWFVTDDRTYPSTLKDQANKIELNAFRWEHWYWHKAGSVG